MSQQATRPEWEQKSNQVDDCMYCGKKVEYGSGVCEIITDSNYYIYAHSECRAKFDRRDGDKVVHDNTRMQIQATSLYTLSPGSLLRAGTVNRFLLMSRRRVRKADLVKAGFKVLDVKYYPSSNPDDRAWDYTLEAEA